MGNILGWLVGVAISFGLYVVYGRYSAKARAADASDDAPWRKDAAPRQVKVGFLFVLFGGAFVLFLGVRQYQKLQDRRHPAVDEHRDELIRAAALALHCGDDRVTVEPQEPTLARVEGCGQSLTLRWGPVLNRSDPRRSKNPFWHEIDPNCRIDYMGCAMPCE